MPPPSFDSSFIPPDATNRDFQQYQQERIDPNLESRVITSYEPELMPTMFDSKLLDEETIRVVTDTVLLDVRTAEDSMQPWLTRIQESLRMYEQDRQQDDEPFEGASNLSMGDATIAVENMHPRLFGAIWNEDLGHQIEAEDPGSVANLPNTRRFMDWVYRVDMRDLFDKLDENVHSTVMTGTQVAWVRWDKMRRMVPDVAPTAAGRNNFRMAPVIHERSFVDNLTLEDFLVPISEGQDHQTMSFNARRYFLSIGQVHELIRRGVLQLPTKDFDLNI